MRIYKRGPTWWASWTENGVTVKRSTRCASKDAARKVAERWELERADPRHHAKNEASFLAEASLFIDACVAQGKASGTLNVYKCKARHLVKHLPEKLSKINPVTVDAYFATRRSEGASVSTMNKEWKVLRAILRGASRRQRWDGELDTLKPEWVREAYVPRERRLTWPELYKLVHHLSVHRAALVLFIVATGARWSEVTRATREDVGENAVRLRGTKTRAADRVVPIAPMFREALDCAVAYADHAKGLLFRQWLTVNRDLRAACRRARIQRVSPNDLRRTFASLLSDAGAANQVVAKLMGHTTTTMVDRVYNRPTTESLAALLERQTAVPPVSQNQSRNEEKEETKEG